MVGDSGDFEMNNDKKKRLGCVDHKGHEIVLTSYVGIISYILT